MTASDNQSMVQANRRHSCDQRRRAAVLVVLCRPFQAKFDDALLHQVGLGEKGTTSLPLIKRRR